MYNVQNAIASYAWCSQLNIVHTHVCKGYHNADIQVFFSV